MNYGENRRFVLRAFQDLRKNKLTCRPNFSCCNSCAVVEMSEYCLKRGDVGGVFWHKQDEVHLKETGLLNVGFFTIDESIKTTREIGLMVASALEKHGLFVCWNGDKNTKIMVDLGKMLQ